MHFIKIKKPALLFCNYSIYHQEWKIDLEIGTETLKSYEIRPDSENFMNDSN